MPPFHRVGQAHRQDNNNRSGNQNNQGIVQVILEDKRKLVVLLVVLTAVGLNHFHPGIFSLSPALNPYNPTAPDGVSPASTTRTAAEHWEYIQDDSQMFIQAFAGEQWHGDEKMMMHGYVEVDTTARGDFDLQFGGVTRCSTTVFGLIHYFCGLDAARGRPADPYVDNAVGLYRRFIEAMKAADPSETHQEMVVRMNLPQGGVGVAEGDMVGHTWVIHHLPDGTFRLYQSFLGRYSLGTYMEGHPDVMTADDLLHFMDNIEIIVSAEEWDIKANTAYTENFGVNFHDSVYFTQLDEDSKIHFFFDVSCVLKDVDGGVHDRAAREGE